MDKIIVKRGFNHEKIYYKSGTEVSESLAKLFPEHVKVLPSLEEEIINPVVEEVVEEKEEAPVEEVKVAKKSKNKKNKK